LRFNIPTILLEPAFVAAREALWEEVQVPHPADSVEQLQSVQSRLFANLDANCKSCNAFARCQ